MRYQVTCPIIKSSNDFGYNVPVGYISYQTVWMNPAAISNQLSVAFRGTNNPKSRIGIVWDDSAIPKNKLLVNAELHYYGTRGHSDTVYYTYDEFTEGSLIPGHEPADGSVPSGAKTGQNNISLGVPKGNSVILYADLFMYSVPIYTPDGHYAGTSDYAESWQFYSQRNTANQPYVVITYDDMPPSPPSSLYPDKATEDPRNIIRFAWAHNSEISQKSFELQYSLDGGSIWTTISEITPIQYYDMVAETLPTTGTVLWKVRTTDTNNEISEYSQASFTLGVPPQKAPIQLAPISQYMSELEPIRFEWLFSGGSVYDIQTKYDLKYSTDNGSTWTTITNTSGDTSHTIDAETLSKGNITWKIRTHNQWLEESPYSDVKSFTVIGRPSIPLIIDVSNKARPVMKWQTQEQHLYEVEIIKSGVVIYKTNIVPNITTREILIPEYLDNGEYTARLRIINEYGLQSPWAEKVFSISVVKPDTPNITIYNYSFKVTIMTDSQLSALIYRDGYLIGEAVSGLFEDFTGESERAYEYYIRAIDKNDSFSDSEIKLGRCKLTGNTLAPQTNPRDYILLKYGFDDIPKKNSKISLGITLLHYDGRKYPVAEYSEFIDEEKSVTFYFETKSEVERLIKVISSNKNLFYRDIDGDVIIGCITALNYTKTILGYEVSFTIVRTV